MKFKHYFFSSASIWCSPDVIEVVMQSTTTVVTFKVKISPVWSNDSSEKPSVWERNWPPWIESCAQCHETIATDLQYIQYHVSVKLSIAIHIYSRLPWYQ